MPQPNFIEQEKEILKFWQENKIFEKLRAKNQGKKHWSFIDGPITANNPMGVHHAWGRTLKDFYQRYKAMQGFDQRYQNGFDCQGLWVEVEVEKNLGFNSKKDIENYGLDKFSKACRARVEKYSKVQEEQSIRLGQWMDWQNSYFTMSETNNLYIWYFLKECHKKGWLTKGTQVVPWCARCGTAVSAHEMSDGGYKELTHDSVYLRVKVTSKDNEYFLVWTTTPWTLPANVALAIQPDLDYVKVKGADNEIYILAKTVAQKMELEIIEEFKGKKLLDLKYESLFPELKIQNFEHQVIPWKEVSEEEGTGIVHIAPGCGAEDSELGKDFNLPTLAPIDETGNYYNDYDWLSGKNAQKVPADIFKSLKEKGLFYQTEKTTHRYPTCWRCKEELVFRVTEEWYLKADEIRPLMKKTAQTVNWLPEFAGLRMQDWLDNMGDWPISRKRFWGLVLPFYECSCGELVVIGSKEELKEMAVDPSLVDKLPEVHRPWIDEVKIKCPKCGRKVSRIPEVGDCWLDAGIVPFSTLKYLEDKDYWQKWFPAEFICESLPQIKLWFYSMLFMSVTLEDTTPYKAVLTYQTVLDEKGDAMHKSTGNAIWFDDAVEKMGADNMRWLYLAGNPANNLLFGFNLAKEAQRKLLILSNVFSFHGIYKSRYKVADKCSPRGPSTSPGIGILDKWIVAKLNLLIQEVTDYLEKFEADKATNIIEKFIVDNLSTWWLRRSRERFKSDDKEVGQAAFNILHCVLSTLIKVMAPFVPFLAEHYYKEINSDRESVHLEDWPRVDEKLINKNLLDEMEQVLKIVELGHAIRAEQGLKVRQPLRELRVMNYELRSELLDLIKEELNVKGVETVKKVEAGKNWVSKTEGDSTVSLDTEITDELKREGVVRELTRQINALRKEAGLTIEDRISIYYQTKDKETEKIFTDFVDKIKSETLADDLRFKKVKVKWQKNLNINGDLWLGLESKLNN